ncbi:arginine--tRNA ligase [Candidatus Bipolaricaulota bacterium]|nr:arginine--tRNA ligase [Candidatus Bipolaricaulota bacterium]
MLKLLIENLLIAAWKKLELPATAMEVHPSERPEFGDFSTNLALVGARVAGFPPRELAERLAKKLPKDAFSQLEIAGPGFINLFLHPSTIQAALQEILKMGNRFGCSKCLVPISMQIEFVSSNPTGPLTVGHGRQAVLGDVLASLYETLGYTVHREYYFNDEGHQIDLLSRSLWARYRQLLGDSTAVPEEGYHGSYLIEIARNLKDQYGDDFQSFDEETALTFREEAVSRITTIIKDDLAQLGIEFDVWFSEGNLHRNGEVNAALESLRRKDGIYEKDGAVWLKAEENGGVKDSVLVRSDGRPTYLMVDIAYHINKRERKFDWVIDVQGADHQVEQSCVKAAMRILDYPEDFLDYAVHQFVSIKEGGQIARMSTRAGRFILLRELVNELGRDVVRYFMVARKPESHLEFDMDLARAESLDNPVYYIQYAHTRIASIFRKARALAIDPAKVDLSPLRARAELDLIKRLDRFPEVLEEAALGFAPHLLTDYALGLARAFHAYYTEHRIIGENESLMAARLSLLSAVQTVFHRSLSILGMSAPEAM